ncbi:DUF2934 domain-containing protein [Rhizobium sp. Root1204]|uniref:DUF2934 domain-containing protein n=1 Tax=Rhizobium sp. Root1204 TaxID=1736428 RepID=UPI0009E7D2C8|nr:DUF2934 domain-containing protein [Rhizobium sp. Root1204]
MSDEQLQWVNDRAYAIWDAMGRPHGQDEAHWFQASSEYEVMTNSTAPESGTEGRKLDCTTVANAPRRKKR